MPVNTELIFTLIAHKDKVYKIMTGWDEGLTYKIGDKVKWWPTSRVGQGIDGVYVDMSAPEGGVAVVISDQVVSAIGTYDPEDFEEAHKALEAKWVKVAPPSDAWPEEAWLTKEAAAKKKGFKRIATGGGNQE